MLKDKIHDGPFYTAIGGIRDRGGLRNAAARFSDNTAKARFDAFQGMPTYSQRFKKKVRTLPVLRGGDFGKCYL